MDVYKNMEKDCSPIISIIEDKGRGRLDSSLHLAVWFLNPLHYYAKDEVVKKSSAPKAIVLECAEFFFFLLIWMFFLIGFRL